MDRFSRRECDVARLVSEGHTNKQIAAVLSIGPRRVRVIVSAIAYKIGADATRDERLQVAVWWHAQQTDPKRSTA